MYALYGRSRHSLRLCRWRYEIIYSRSLGAVVWLFMTPGVVRWSVLVDATFRVEKAIFISFIVRFYYKITRSDVKIS